MAPPPKLISCFLPCSNSCPTSALSFVCLSPPSPCPFCPSLECCTVRLSSDGRQIPSPHSPSLAAADAAPWAQLQKRHEVKTATFKSSNSQIQKKTPKNPKLSLIAWWILTAAGKGRAVTPKNTPALNPSVLTVSIETEQSKTKQNETERLANNILRQKRKICFLFSFVLVSKL